MAPEMMRTTNSFSCKKGISTFLVFLLISFSCFAEKANPKWTLAAEKFTYTRGQETNAVTEATAETLPARILEKTGQALVRSVDPDERFERYVYESRKNRTSLFLQLSSEYRKRDSIVLNNYSDRELKRKLAEQEEKIAEIQEKIDANLEELKEEQNKTERLKKQENNALENQQKSNSELFRYSSLVKNLFTKTDPVFTSEDIVFYKNDISALFTPTEKAVESGYLSYPYEKECVTANINTLLTGSITAYGEYISVNVDLYLYPGARLAGSVMEVGTIQEFDMMSTNIARELVPIITNSMPVQVDIEVASTKSEVFLYIDDQLQVSFPPTMIFDSGVHTVQFTAEGYTSATTSYFFEGNKHYKIEVQLEEIQNGSMLIGVVPTNFDLFYQKLPGTQKYSQNGTIYYNGVSVSYDEQERSQITINGNKILGQFISEDGKTDFYYIPEKLIYNGSLVSINPQAFDRSAYIETRRKWMYGSYSALITSLIPTFICMGQYKKYYNRFVNFYQDGLATYEDAELARKWIIATNVSEIISACCGAFFTFELIRYFKGANSVLPDKAKPAKEVKPVYQINKEKQIVEPTVETAVVEEALPDEATQTAEAQPEENTEETTEETMPQE